jgi:periplasmic protein TonB
MHDDRAWPERAVAGAAVAILHAVLLALLIWAKGLPAPSGHAATTIAVVPIDPPARPAPRVVRPRTSDRARRTAAPPNLRAEPTAILAVNSPVPTPPPIVSAPLPAEGRATSAGAAAVPGPGPGASGVGDGTGGGGSGGDGDGPGGLPPRWRKGRIRNSDYPRAAGEAGVSGTVGVRYRVAADGRVSDCRITRSSGSTLLDATTCRLIERRFRFDPARDEDGRPVASSIVEQHNWISEPDPAG